MKSYEPNIKIKNLKKEPINGIYIGRKNGYYGLEKSKWHNPIKLEKESDRRKVYDEYIRYIKSNDELYNTLEELDNHDLFCYCTPKLCHGDALVELLAEKRNNINSVLELFTEEHVKIRYMNFQYGVYNFDISICNENTNIYNAALKIHEKIMYYKFVSYTMQCNDYIAMVIPIDSDFFKINTRQLKLNDMFTLL